MAKSIIRVERLGPTTLIMAISACAALLPPRSMASAAFKHSRRAISMPVRASAMRSSHSECSAMGLPKAVRESKRRTIFSNATSEAPMLRMQW